MQVTADRHLEKVHNAHIEEGIFPMQTSNHSVEMCNYLKSNLTPRDPRQSGGKEGWHCSEKPFPKNLDKPRKFQTNCPESNLTLWDIFHNKILLTILHFHGGRNGLVGPFFILYFYDHEIIC